MGHVGFGMNKNWLATAVLAAVFMIGCGGGETPEPKTPGDDVTPPRANDGPKMSASAEIGALDEEKVTAAFHGSMADLQKCLIAGAERNELEGGHIGFFIKIDSSGHIVHVRAEQSTIGDRDTEKCMFKVLKSQTWPEPQGGDFGIAHNSFDFDMPNDVRPPTSWESDRVDDTVHDIASKVAGCKRGVHGDLSATVYVDTDGTAVSAGIAASDEAGESAADCLSSLLKGAKYPSPGSWPAKVSFTL